MHTEIQTYARTVSSVFGQLLRKGWAPLTAWVAGTRFGVNNLRSDDDRDPVGGWLYVACFAPKNYVHVLAAFSERPRSDRDLQELDWQPITCHDSCWRDALQSTLVDAQRILVNGALREFGCQQPDLYLHLMLDLLVEVPEPERMLRSGLEKSSRHGKLMIPRYSGLV